MVPAKRSEGWEDRVRAATVTLPERGGRGVLAPGGLVLTATHCLGWDGSLGLALGDHHPVLVEAGGCSFRLGPRFGDGVSDMAALGALDDQAFPNDERVFAEWQRQLRPVPLSPWLPRTPDARRLRRQPEPWVSHPARLLSLDGRWFAGVVKYDFDPSGKVWLEAEEPLESGMSGGPVVDEQGRLLGVISWGSEYGQIPPARFAMPAWILALFRQAAVADAPYPKDDALGG